MPVGTFLAVSRYLGNLLILGILESKQHHKNLTEITLPNTANKEIRFDSCPLLFGYKEGSEDINDYILKQIFVMQAEV